MGPGARETLPVTITVVNTDGIDRLWANAYDDATGEQLAAFSKGFYTKNPSTEVKMVFPSEGASPEKPVGGTVYFKNPFGARGTCTLRLKATDPAGKIVETERSFEAGEGEVSASFELSLPEDAFSGECVALAFVSLKGSVIGVGSGRVFYTGESKPLKGKVVDRITGSPVPGCEVALHLGETVFSSTAGSDGSFSMSVPNGRFTVEASSGDHNYYTAESLIGPPDRDDFTIALTPLGKGEGTGTVAGRVLDRISGETCQGCRIDFVKGGETYTVTSDASGGYSIALTPGDYIARCFIEGKSWNTSEFPVRVTEGWDQPLDLYVPIGKVRLRALDRISGKEAEGVTALLKTGETSDNEGWNRDVSFAVNGGPAALTTPGRRELRLYAPGYAAVETEIFAGEREAETVLWLMPERSGVRVVCRDLVSGKPLEGAAISVGRPDQAPSEARTADARGESFFSLTEGRWFIGADLHGYAPARTETYSTPHPAGADPEVTIYLQRDTQKNPGTAKISVLDLLSGKPVPDVLVTPASPEGFDSGKTDEDGAVSLELPDGRVPLRFEKEGYAALETELFNSYLDESTKVFYLDPDKAAASFTVRDHFSGKELKGARVSRLDGQNAHDLGAAGEDGTLGTELPRGRLALRFELEGYRTLDTEFYISGNGGGVQAGEEVYLYPQKTPHPFRCVVKDPDGAPVPSVSVTLKSGDRTLTLITGRDGGFSAPLSEGPLELAFSAEGYHELKTQSWFSFSSQPTDPEEYRLFPSDAPYPAGPGRIEFSVRDALTGEPLKAFSAYLLDNGWARYEDGTAGTEAAPGNKNTAIRAPRYKETGSFFPTVFPGFTVKRTICLHPSGGAVEFSVRDGQTGRPLEKFSAYLLDNGWAGYEDGMAETEAEPGNKNTAIWAPGYYETGSFFPTVFPGRTVTRTIFMQPSAGRVEFSVKDAVTGGPVGTFQAYLLDNGWARYEGGRAETEAAPGNKNTAIKAPLYKETGSFFPAAFPGRTVTRTVYLMPASGRVEFSVRDAITGEPLKAFQAYLLDNGWAGYRDGKAGAEAAPGNKNTSIRSPGYNETGNFYPAAFPGRTAACTVFLLPAEGKVSFKVADAITGNPPPSFSAYLVDNGWARYEGGSASSASGAGNKNTEIRADGYSGERFYPGVFPGRTAEYTVFLHPVEPAGHLNISCVDVATGKKVADATLRPQGERDIPAPDGTAAHTSGAHYKQQWFRASAPGYREADGPGFFIAGRRDLSLVIPMEKVMAPGRGDFLATVTDADGNPIRGAETALSCSGNIVRGRTNKSGQILFRNVPSGVHTLSASSKGYSGGAVKIAAEARETAKARLSLEALSSRGRRAPFDVEIVSAPSDETLRPGEMKTLRVLLGNRGDEGGRVYCSLELPDLGKMVKEVILGAGERVEVPFEVTMPDDSVSSRITGLVRVGEKTKKALLAVSAPVFSMTAKTDREAYLEGETLEVEVEVASDGASGEYQLRVGFNDETRVENIRLEGGRGRAVFSGIPVAFRGNRLLYGLYHPAGRSILLNALSVRDRSAAALMLPDRQQYNAGETVKLKIIGKGGDAFSVSSPLIPGKSAGEEGVIEALANTEGIAFIEAALPAGLATGVYPFRCGGYSAEVDVRGLEARILDRRLEEDVGSGELRLHWSMESSAEIPCKWTVEAIPQDDEPYEAASGDIKLNNGAWDYWIPVEPYDDEPCDLLLKLEPASGGEPLAAVRYSWAGLQE